MSGLGELNEKLEGCLEFERVPLGRDPVAPCAPCGIDSSGDRTIYPNLWISRLAKPLKMSDEGRAVIDYRIENRSSSMRQGKPEEHSVDMKVIAIEPVKKGGALGTALPTNGGAGKVKSFSELDGELDSVLSEFADRNRDEAGRYAAGQAGATTDDFRAAGAATGKRKLLRTVAGAAALAGSGGLVAGTKMGRKAAGRLGNSVMRGVKRITDR